jgi:non-canonical purine NTP pyrophosphatase (RdgB/HAM1 family)
MKQLLFATGNPDKFITAQHTCEQYGIQLVQLSTNLTEIQEEDAEKVALNKAAKAFEVVQKPIVITDDSWSFYGLNGFPGVYMHSINKWFSPEDFLRLTSGLEDRRVVLTQCLVYIDDQKQKVFRTQTTGTLLKEARGTSKYSHDQVISLAGDNGQSIAEAYDKAKNKSTRKSARVWHYLAEWLSQES